MRTSIAMSGLLAVVLGSSFAAAEPPQPSQPLVLPPVFEQIAFFEDLKAELRRGGEASPWEVATGWLDAAEARLAEGGRWSDQLFTEAGLAFLNGGWPRDAVAVFERLEQVAKSDSMRRYAAYKAGEILLLDLRAYEQAVEAFRRYREMTFADGAEAWEADGARGRLGLATLYMAAAQRGAGDRSAAIETRASLLETPGAAGLSDERFAKLCVENGRDEFVLGDIEAGRAWFDLLFSERPEVGLDDGRGISWRNERVRADRSLRSVRDDQSLKEYLAIWNDPVLWKIPEIMHTAHGLETALRARRSYNERLDVLADAWEHFNRNEVAWRAAHAADRMKRVERPFQAIAVNYALELKRAKRWDDVVFIATDFLARYPQSRSRAVMQKLVAEASKW